MEFTDRRKCFCSECKGQLVARRTLYEHKRRNLLKKENYTDIEPITDPFDADISSDEDVSRLEAPSTTNLVVSDSDEGRPSAKQPRLQVRQMIIKLIGL